MQVNKRPETPLGAARIGPEKSGSRSSALDHIGPPVALSQNRLPLAWRGIIECKLCSISFFRRRGGVLNNYYSEQKRGPIHRPVGALRWFPSQNLSPLECALTNFAPASALESALAISLDLKPFRIRTYEKIRGGGGLMVNFSRPSR